RLACVETIAAQRRPHLQGLRSATALPARLWRDCDFAHPRRRGGFDGTCNVTAAGGEQISLGNLPAGYVPTGGDFYISFPWLGGRILVKALETVTGNRSGIISNLTVAPWLRASGAVPATATVIKAWCEMTIKPGTWSGDGHFYTPVSFEAIQKL